MRDAMKCIASSIKYAEFAVSIRTLSRSSRLYSSAAYRFRPLRFIILSFKFLELLTMKLLPSLLASSLALLISSTSAAPHVSPSLSKRCTNSASDRSCWGYYDLSTNYYDEVPDTGVTVEVCFPVTIVSYCAKRNSGLARTRQHYSL